MDDDPFWRVALVERGGSLREELSSEDDGDGARPITVQLPTADGGLVPVALRPLIGKGVLSPVGGEVWDCAVLLALCCEAAGRLEGAAASRLRRVHVGAGGQLPAEVRAAAADSDNDSGKKKMVGDLELDHVHAAKDDEVEGRRREGLTHQQGPSGLNGQIDRCERAGLAACLQKRGAGAIDEVDGAAHSAASGQVVRRFISG